MQRRRFSTHHEELSIAKCVDVVRVLAQINPTHCRRWTITALIRVLQNESHFGTFDTNEPEDSVISWALTFAAI